MRVLMVEDERYMAEAVASVLKKNNYTVDLAFNGEDGLDAALSGIYDLVILDINLPKRDGLSLLREMRGAGLSVPVILLTAKGETEDKVKGLDFGADDYLAKPFKTDELLARLRALSRRKAGFIPQSVLTFGDIELNPHTLMLQTEQAHYKLTLKESQLLELLINMRGMVISKNAIIEKLWGYETEAEDNHVEVYVSFLRKKLLAMQSKTVIQTIRGVGYMLTVGKG